MAGRLATVRTGVDYAVATRALVLGQEVAMGSRLARLGVLAAVVLVAACGGGRATSTAESRPTGAPPAALDVLTGPWRAEPVVLDPLLAAAADRACRTDPEFPNGVHMVLVDARGGGKLVSYYDGPAGSAVCGYLEIDPTGTIKGSLSEVSGDSAVGAPPGRLSGMSATGSDGGETGAAWQEVHGRAGPGITRVVITVEDIGAVTATLRDGLFSAWWPIDEIPRPHVWMKDYVVNAYDILGQPIDRYSKCGPGPC